MDMLGIEGIIEKIGNGLDKLFTSDDERAQAKIILDRIKLQPKLLRLLTNMEESKNKSLFVSGWRPFFGWVCSVGFAYDFIVKPMLCGIGMHAPTIDTVALINLFLKVLN